MKLEAKEYGDGRPLIVLHGILGAGSNWHSISKNIFSQHFRVFALDLRNHGHSPHGSPMTLRVMAEDVIEFMDDHELESATLLGHSMGGKVAMELAVHHPEKLDRLIVVDISPFGYPDGHTHLFRAMSDLRLDSFEKRPQVDAALAVDVRDLAIRQFLLKNLHRGSEGFEWRINLPQIIVDYDHLRGPVTEAVCTVPTLFIRGTKSDYITDNDIDSIRKQFPNSTFVDIADAGHWVHAEQPEQLAKEVISFSHPSIYF